MQITLRSLVIFAAAVSITIHSHAGEHPNVLMIAVDDLNDWIGCLGGHPDSRTPAAMLAA